MVCLLPLILLEVYSDSLICFEPFKLSFFFFWKAKLSSWIKDVFVISCAKCHKTVFSHTSFQKKIRQMVSLKKTHIYVQAEIFNAKLALKPPDKLKPF